MFDQLPETQQQIALEYIKQQVQIVQKVRERMMIDEIHKEIGKKEK